MKPFFQDQLVTIYHADCREVLPELPRPDHLMSDPPYSPITHSNARTNKDHRRRNHGQVRPLRGAALVDFDSWDAEQIGDVLDLAYPKRWIVATVDYHAIPKLEARFARGCPIEFIRHGVWVKTDGGAPQITGDRPGQGWEAVAILHPKGKKRWNGGGRWATWNIPTANAQANEHSKHPTQKPVRLLKAWIEAFTDPGDLILDPWGGSGTTARAAKDLGRRCILIESDPKWVEEAAARMGAATPDQKIQLDEERIAVQTGLKW